MRKQKRLINQVLANEREETTNMFLQKDELKTVAQVAIIDKITNLDDGIIEDIIDESISLMSGYLSRHYNYALIFSQIGAARHKAVLKRLKDIVIYEIYERHTREQNAVAARRYNEAMKWLEELNTGERGDHTLPPKVEDPSVEIGTAGDTRYGGNVRYKSIY